MFPFQIRERFLVIKTVVFILKQEFCLDVEKSLTRNAVPEEQDSKLNVEQFVIWYKIPGTVVLISAFLNIHFVMYILSSDPDWTYRSVL